MMDAQTITEQLGGSWRNGAGNAACPCCQSSRQKDQNALSIGDANGKLLLYCFKDGCSFADIASAVNLPFGDVQIDSKTQHERKTKQAEYSAYKLKSAVNLWNRTIPINDTRAERYLRGRGITCDLPDTLRFLPDIYHTPSGQFLCAMIANVQPSGGIHRTFFTKLGKRIHKNAKMMLGPCAGGAVRLSEGNGPLVVCEGIETGLSLLSGLLSGPVTIWAALSTSGMMGLQLPTEPHSLIIAPDGDDAGRKASHVLARHASKLGWEVSLLSAPEGEDWNDVLMDGAT